MFFCVELAAVADNDCIYCRIPSDIEGLLRFIRIHGISIRFVQEHGESRKRSRKSSHFPEQNLPGDGR